MKLSRRQINFSCELNADHFQFVRKHCLGLNFTKGTAGHIKETQIVLRTSATVAFGNV